MAADPPRAFARPAKVLATLVLATVAIVRPSVGDDRAPPGAPPASPDAPTPTPAPAPAPAPAPDDDAAAAKQKRQELDQRRLALPDSAKHAMARLDRFRDRDFRLWASQRADVLAAGADAIPALEIALEELDWEVRAFAASCLARLRVASTAPALERAFAEERYAEARRQIVLALAAIRAPTSEAAFRAAAQSTDPGVRLAGVRGLGALGRNDLAPAIAPFRDDADLDLRYEARGALAAAGDPQALEALLAEAKALVADRDKAREVSGEDRDDGDRYAQYLLGVALARSTDERATRILVAALLGEKPWENKAFLRMGAAEGLGRRAADGTPLPARVVAGMEHDRVEVRVACTYAVGIAANPEHVAKIGRALADSQLDVKVNACVALGRIGTPAAVKLLHRALSDRADEVRLAAVRALGAVREPEATKALLDGVRDDKYVVRTRAVHDLALRTADPGVAAALVKAARDPDFGVREQALAALAHDENGAEALDAVKSALGDPDSGVRANACRALAEIAASAGVVEDEALARRLLGLHLGATEPRLERAAGDYFDAVRPAVVVPMLFEAMQADTDEVRARAARVLRRISGRDLPFDPAGDRSAREADLARWKEWWSRTGRLPPREARTHLVITGDLLTAAKDFKWKGLDVALLLDSTGSMAGLIRGAKESIDEIVEELSTLLPSLRVSVYTYRDHGDDYLYYGTPLTYDTGHLAGFLQNAVQGQGGDIPEAVYEVVTNAFDRLAWRPAAHKVVVFAGDAPYHPEQQTDLLRAVRAFCTPKNQAELHAIFTDTNRRALDVRARRERPSLSKVTSPFFEKYELAAKAGRGKAILLDDESVLVKELLVLAFGERWREDVETVLDFER